MLLSDNSHVLPDIDKVTRLIREVAEEEILPRFQRLDEKERWEKRPGSWVTVADKAAEERLTQSLGGLLAGSQVVGEEAVEENPELLHRLTGDGAVWIVDPVDGTANFAADKPDFAVIVALAIDGETRAGWIHSPMRNVTATAVAGEGAWMGSSRLAVAPPAPVSEMTGSLGRRLRENTDFSGRFAGVTNTKCCGVDYLAIVTGGIHFAYYRSVKPWDHAAGQLIHREAGGYGACLDGADYRPGVKAEGGLLLTPDDAAWSAIAADIPAAFEATA